MKRIILLLIAFATFSCTKAQKTEFSNQFKNAGQAELEEKTSKMSSTFNKASKNNSPARGPNPIPSVDL